MKPELTSFINRLFDDEDTEVLRGDDKNDRS